MNAAINKDYRTALYAPNIKKPAIISALLHVCVFLLATVGIPYISKDIEPQDIVIPVELFDPSEIIKTTNFDEPEKIDKQDDVPPPERKPVYNNTDIIPDLVTPEEPDIEEIAPDPSSIIRNPPKPTAKPKPPKHHKPIQDKPKKDNTPKRDITSLLKSLKPDESEKVNKNNHDLGHGNTSNKGNMSKQMSGSDLIALIRGVQPCWNINAGGQYADNKVVKLRVLVNRDRSVKDVIIIDNIRYFRDGPFKSAADAARWALLNPKCSILNLPPEKYETWKSFIFVFDPSQML